MKRLVLALVLFAALAGTAQAAPRLLAVWNESSGPSQIAVTSAGDVWVLYPDVPKAVRYNAKGVQQAFVPLTGEPSGLAADPGGNAWIDEVSQDTVTE